MSIIESDTLISRDNYLWFGMKYIYGVLVALAVLGVCASPAYAASSKSAMKDMQAQLAKVSLEKQVASLCSQFTRKYPSYDAPWFCKPQQPTIVAQCADGVDNDADGKVDMADSGCENATDNNEFTATSSVTPQCSDGVDNDADGKIDYPADTGCESAADNNEFAAPAAPQCSDGLDNDGDGKVDYPTDPGCASTVDTTELNTTVPGQFASVSRASEVPSQNVAENVSNQPLGGFVVDVNNEAITVHGMVYHVTLAGSGLVASGSDITNVTLVDENGAVVAGPVDGTDGGTVTFTDGVTFPKGRHVYTVKGKLGTDFTNGNTVVISTKPVDDWSNATGLETGVTISLASLTSTISGNTMTVKSAVVALSVASSPAAKNVVAGVAGLLVSNIQFDATQSGEDIKFSSAKFLYTDTGMTADVVNCFAYDGTTRLNNTAVNPTTTATDYTFTLDTNLTVAKGTVKTVSIKCDIPGSATSGSFSFGITGFAGNATFTGIGIGSSQTVTPTATTNVGSTMTIASGGGTFTVSPDASTPAYAIAAGGTTGVTLGVLRFDASDQDMKIDRVALQMSNSVATSSPSDLIQVTLWDGTTQVGTALFTGTNRYATSTLTQNVIVPANGYKTLTLKGDLSAIGTGQPGHQGSLIQVDYDGNDSMGTRAIGQSSGSVINAYPVGDTTFAGVRVFKSFPTFARLSVPSTTLASGTNTIYRFSVTSNSSGGISINELTINLATSSINALANLNVYAYTDSGFSSPVSGFSNGLLTGSIAVPTVGNNEYDLGTDELAIPAGTTYYFEVKVDATITATTGTSQITTKIVGDSAFPTPTATLMSTADTIEGLANDNFIWSPNATTTSQTTHADWTNGYGVLGLPATYTDAVTLSKTN